MATEECAACIAIRNMSMCDKYNLTYDIYICAYVYVCCGSGDEYYGIGDNCSLTSPML